jgi:ubiquinone/menaquinone biosynthesis C-methylase UbiE
MLERAAAKFGPAPGATPLPVTLCKATAEYLPLTAGSIDFAVSTNAFHFFRNKATALAEMYRVLRPHGGRLVITDWCNDYWLVRLYHWMERARWSRYRHRYPGPLGTEELRTLVSQAGFLDVRVERYRVLVGGAAPWGMQTITAVRA